MRTFLLLIVASACNAAGLLCLGPAGAGNLTLSTSAGSWTQCEGGGTGIPNDDFIVWRSTGTFTIDQNLTSRTIRMENGTITVNAGVSLKFSSTGTNWVGSGSTANPGMDANMFGIKLAKGTAFNLSGTANSRIPITSVNGTSPIYIDHVWGDWTGCTTVSANVCNGATQFGSHPTVNISYTDFTNLGDGSNQGVQVGGGATVTSCASCTVTGSTGNTCTISFTNGGGTGGTAIVALSGTNTIANGTTITALTSGTGYTSAPTSGTLSKQTGNTATACGGTATVSTSLYDAYGLVIPSNDAARTFSVDHSTFTSPYQIQPVANTFTFTNNSIVNPQAPQTITTIASPSNWVTTGNTMQAGTGVSTIFLQFVGAPTGLDLEQNAFWNSGSASVQIQPLHLNGASAATNSTVVNNYSECAEPTSSGTCSAIAAGITTSDTSTNYSRNVWRGGTAAFLYGAAGKTLTSQYQWGSEWKEEGSSQGLMGIFQASGSTITYHFYNDIAIAENSLVNPPVTMVLQYSGSSYATSDWSHNTTIGAPNSDGVYFGEGNSTVVGGLNGSGRSNIALRGSDTGSVGNEQMHDGNSHNTWFNSFNGAGVHHNLTCCAAATPYSNPPQSTGFDNGTTHHPSALYGDLTVDPMLVDTVRRPCNFGKLIGLDGTCSTLFTALASRALGTGPGGCTNGVCGTFTDASVGAVGVNVIEYMRLWLFGGVVPGNPATWCAGSDGEAVGAVAMCGKGKAMLGAIL